MKAPRSNSLAFLCMVTWISQNAIAQTFVPDQTVDDYEAFAVGLGSLIGGIEKDDKPDLEGISRSLNRIGGLMQGVTGPTGAPPFADENLFKEIEAVFTRMGPYVCLLPYSTPKDTMSMSPVLGGMIGGLIGEAVAKERLKKRRDSDSEISMISGVGTIAGAMGGMSGWEVTRGRFGKPKSHPIVQRIPKFVEDLGDMKSMLKGSFQPLSEPKHKNLKLLIERDMGKGTRKMSAFIKMVKTGFEGNSTEAVVEAKSTAFNQRFRAIDSELAKIAKSVSSMAGVYGGIIGYILPRYDEERRSLPEKTVMHHSSQNNSEHSMSSVNETLREDAKNVSKTLRMFLDVAKNDKVDKWDVFSGALNDIADSAGEIGGYSGVIGGMMGEVMANGAAAQAGKFLGWGSKKEEDDDDENGPRISKEDILTKLEKSLPPDGIERLDHEQKTCIQSIAVGVEHFGRLHKYGDILPGALHYKGPFGEEEDGVSAAGVQRRLVGDQWDGDWMKPPTKTKLVDTVKYSELVTTIQEESLEENAVRLFINKMVSDKGADSELLQLLTGKLKFKDASSDDIKSLSVETLAGLKPSVVETMTAQNIFDIFTSEMVGINPTLFKKFLKSVTDKQIDDALVIVNQKKDDGQWGIYSETATAIIDSIIHKFGDEAYSKLCPFASGMSSGAIKRADHKFLVDTDLVSCMRDAKDELPKHVKVELTVKAKESEDITVEYVNALKGFTDQFEEFLWYILSNEQLTELIDIGHFLVLENICPVKRKEMMNAIKMKLNISSEQEESTRYLRNLGELICGILPSELENTVPEKDLEEFRTNWTRECVTEPNNWRKQREKSCAEFNYGAPTGICKELLNMKGPKRIAKLESHKETRSAVKKGLHTGKELPLIISYFLNGLTQSEIESIPDNVLDSQLEVVSEITQLSFPQKRQILKKIIDDGKSLNSLDDLKSIGRLLPAVDLSSVSVDLANEVLAERPNLLTQFPKIKKAFLMEKLFNEMSAQQLINIQTPLSRQIPIDKLRALSSLNMTAIAKMRWTTPQAVEIVDRYKLLNEKSNVKMSDLKVLGRASNGITCGDVAELPLSSMIHLARWLKYAVGNDFSSSLAGCIAVKLHVCIKMGCIKGPDVNDIITKNIPENILMFLPPTILSHVAYGKNCEALIRKLSQSKTELLPPGLDKIAIAGMLQVSEICLDTSQDGYGQASNGGMDEGGPMGGQEGPSKDGMEEKPQDSNQPPPPPTRKKRNSDKLLPEGKEMKEYDGESMENYADTYEYEGTGSGGKMEPEVDGESVAELGKLACHLIGHKKSFTAYGMYELGKIFPICTGSISGKKREDVNAMFQKNIGQFTGDMERGLPALGPMVPFVDPEYIEKNFTIKLAAVLMQNLPTMHLPGRSKLTGDKSNHILNFSSNLGLPRPEKPLEDELDDNDDEPPNTRAFAEAILPKLIEYIITKNKTGKDPAEPPVMQMPSQEPPQGEMGQEDAVSRKRRNATSENATTTTEAPGTFAATDSNDAANSDVTKPTSSAENNEQIDDEEFPESGVTFELVILAGPAIIGLKVGDISSMSETLFKDSLEIMGKYPGWTTEQVDAIKSKMAVYGKSSTWSSILLQDLGHLAVMLDAIDIEELENLDLESLGALARVKWASDDLRLALLNRYNELMKKDMSKLNGIDLIAAGDLLCAISTSDISDLNNDAVKYALESIGKRRCLSKEKISAFKDKALTALGLKVSKPSVLSELGVLGGAMTVDDLKSIPPFFSSLVSPDALRIIDAETVLKGWDESHLALLGVENGAVILSRSDIFKSLNDISKNAVFQAGFGGSANIMSTLIDLMKQGKERSSKAFNSMLGNMLKSVAMLFNIMVPEKFAIPQRGGPGSVYGLVDASSYVRPPPPDFGFGLSENDFMGSFTASFLKDDRLINFINQIAETAKKILDALKGDISFNELADDEIKDVPSTVFVGLKPAQIRDMSPKVVGSMLDSPKAARDPTSMTKVIRRLDTTQFEDAMSLLNKKIKESSNTSKTWKPPIKTQEAMAKNYLSRITTNKSVSDEEVVKKFIENICSIVAGLPSGMIKQIPMVESKKKEALDCMAESYKDLSSVQKKQITKWALQKSPEVKARSVETQQKSDIPTLDEIKDLGGFMMDVPVQKLRSALSDPNSALELVENGNLEKMDTLHPNYEKLSKMTINKLVNDSKDQFNNKSFLEKLGHSKCEIPLKKVKSSMDKDTMKYLANYTMNECKDKNSMIEESLQECDGEQALRLQRCQLLRKQAGDAFSSKNSVVQQMQWQRPSLDQFKMMRELASSLFDSDLSKMNGDEIKDAAGALGGLNPLQMSELPDSSVLDAMDSIKDNSNLSPKQRKVMFEKAQNAGFSMDKPSSLIDLGGLVSEVPVADFMKISVDIIKNSLTELMKKVKVFSPSQKRAIIGRLENISMDDMLEDDIGDFASEIPLRKLKSLKKVNLTKLKDKPWQRGQASELIDNYLNSTEDGKVDVDLISEMGSTVVGLKCSHIMDLEIYETQEAATSIDAQADMEPDMDECIHTKLDFTHQVEKGEDYMQNDTEEADLETTVEAVPNDVTVFYEPEVVNATPVAVCDTIYQKIGAAQLNTLPPGPSDQKLKELALGAMNCLKRHPDRDFTVLEVEDVEMLGKLICDIPSEDYQGMEIDAYDATLELMKDCFHRFTSTHVAELQALVKNFEGEASAWDETSLGTLGHLLAFMSEEDIQNINDETFAENYDAIVPLKLDESLEAHSLINYDAFYAKAREALTTDNEEEEPTARRRRNTVRVPTYENIVSLGPGNSGWTVEELGKISNDDILAALDVLGNVEDWSVSQMEVLIQRIEGALGQTKTEWTTSHVADAKHILTGLTAEQISNIDISSVETTTSLSDIKWNSDQRVAAFENFMTRTSKAVDTITSEDIAGLGNIFCGMSSIKMSNIPPSVASDTLKEIGELTCYDQEQLDALYAVILESNDDEFPTGALLNTMGSIAAGMTADSLKEISIEDMPMLSVYAIQLMSPVRFKEGMSNTQLAAAGVSNLAEIIRNKPVYNALSVEQRNTVNTAAYGRNAVIEEEAETTGNDDSDGTSTDGTSTDDEDEDHHDDHHEMGNDDDNRNVDNGATTSAWKTTTSEAPIFSISFSVFAACTSFLYYVL